MKPWCAGAGSPGLVLFLAVCLVAAATSYSFLPPNEAGRLTLGLLALLAVVGLVALLEQVGVVSSG